VPYTRQASVGYERQIGTAMAASVDYIRNDLKDLYLRQDLNPALAPARPHGDGDAAESQLHRAVLEITNLGWANSNSLQFSLSSATRAAISTACLHAVEHVRQRAVAGVIDTIDDAGGHRSPSRDGEARTTQDRPHVLSLTGAAEIPKTGGLQLSGSFQYQSGTPFTLTDSTTDDNRNGQFEEPLPAGTYSGAASNVDAISVVNEGGFRGARGPDQMLLSLRGRYSFKLGGGRSLQAWVDVFNITNRANFNTPSSDRRDAATFLILRAVTNPTRTAQLNFRFSF
jgi:hypothetical protein